MAGKPNEISSLLCSECKIYTTSDKTDIICSRCHETYCRKCSHKVHPFTECFKQIDPKDAEHMDETYTHCPGCKALVERSNQCIHMTCKCNTEFCHLCGEKWNKTINFHHIWDGLCPEVAKYPKLKEYIPILTRLSSIINISKSQLKILQKYPKLLQHLIDTEQSIMILGNTPEKIKSLKEDPRFSNVVNTTSNSNNGGGGGGGI
jgi:hypothetical protein